MNGQIDKQTNERTIKTDKQMNTVELMCFSTIFIDLRLMVYQLQ